MICRAEEAGRKDGIKEGIQIGREEGRQVGFVECKLEIAKNMVRKGFANDEIAEITELPIKSILNIK